MASLASAVARLGREALRLGEDRLRKDLPRRVEDIDAAHLTAWLGANVTRATRLDTTSGTTDRARLALEGTDVPASVFVKMPARPPIIRLFGYVAGLGENEVRFFREVRPDLDVTAPALLGSAFDPRVKRYVLVLDDLVAAGATFADTRTPLEPAQSQQVLENLARLHGRYWSSPALDRELSWVRANRDDPMLPVIHRALKAMATRVASDDPDLIPPDGRAVIDAYSEVADRLDRGPHTILHGDPHPGNCYFLAGRAGLFDWQLLRRGNPLRDVTYHMVVALDRDTRRAVERDLLRTYCEALAAHGGPELPAEDVWTAYRRMAAAPFVAAAFTVGMGGLQQDEIAKEGLRRAAAAVVDLGTGAALGLDVRAAANRTAPAGKIRRWRSPRTPT